MLIQAVRRPLKRQSECQRRESLCFIKPMRVMVALAGFARVRESTVLDVVSTFVDECIPRIDPLQAVGSYLKEVMTVLPGVSR